MPVLRLSALGKIKACPSFQNLTGACLNQHVVVIKTLFLYYIQSVAWTMHISSVQCYSKAWLWNDNFSSNNHLQIFHACHIFYWKDSSRKGLVAACTAERSFLSCINGHKCDQLCLDRFWHIVCWLCKSFSISNSPLNEIFNLLRPLSSPRACVFLKLLKTCHLISCFCFMVFFVFFN